MLSKKSAKTQHSRVTAWDGSFTREEKTQMQERLERHLRDLYRDVLDQPLPDQICELLKGLNNSEPSK
jgi:hypothetical protein